MTRIVQHWRGGDGVVGHNEQTHFVGYNPTGREQLIAHDLFRYVVPKGGSLELWAED